MSGRYHILPPAISGAAPEHMGSPFCTSPHPWAQVAAGEVIEQMHAYMRLNVDSELHKQGKMFGVLVVERPLISKEPNSSGKSYGYLKAFSSLLDGSHELEGFVPPVYDFAAEKGYFRREEAVISAIKDTAEKKRRSRALQRWLFAQYNMLSYSGEKRDLLSIFAKERPILTEEEYFSCQRNNLESLPPAGAGECCAPKLLQYAFEHGYRPLAIAEFWVGAPDTRELRHEGVFYGACQGKCRPILSYMLHDMDVLADAPSQNELELRKRVKVLYEDEYLLVALKPAGLLSVPGKNNQLCLEQVLRERKQLPTLRAVYRLDRDTSGIVVMAKSTEIYTMMQRSFAVRDVEKRYEAILCSDAVKDIARSGEISLPLMPNALDRPRQMVDKRYGKQALTRYEIVRRLGNGLIAVYLYPKTGRTHQLRVHCAHPEGLGAPILGDILYGKPADRMYLHAGLISFEHPVTHSKMCFKVSASWF